MTDQTVNNEGAAPVAGAEGASTPPAQDDAADRAAALAFDPFGPPAKTSADTETGTNEGEPKPGEPKPGEPKPVAPAPKPGEKPAAAPSTPPTKTQKEVELEAQVDALKAVIANAPKPAEPAKPAAAPGEEKPFYNLQMPPQIISALRSDDEAEAGMAFHAVINGIANRIYQDVQAQFKELQENLPKTIQTHAGSYISQQREVERVFNDFYGTYPHLNNPAIYPVVQQASQQVAQQWSQAGKRAAWTPEFRDAVYAAVSQIIPAPAAAPPQKPTPKPFVAQPGARPSGAPAGNEFMEVVTAR